MQLAVSEIPTRQNNHEVTSCSNGSILRLGRVVFLDNQCIKAGDISYVIFDDASVCLTQTDFDVPMGEFIT